MRNTIKHGTKEKNKALTLDHRTTIAFFISSSFAFLQKKSVIFTYASLTRRKKRIFKGNGY
ncbi:hypothetical protein CEY02_08400 [Bacillus pumilus]|uniref:Uncharacterized protein n=1 Tax=Bacillus pumilus TaxID=1408 RepID=A0A2A5IW67_BACPU|nr:hypothetical protein CEY02_08400 [Bacillus pumilus]